MATKADAIHGALREQIVTGRRAAGEFLDEAEVAVGFGASRTPVREALRRLRSEGLLAPGSRRRMRVVDVSGQAHEVALLRVALEGTAAERACAVVEPGSPEVDRLRVAVRRQRRTAATGDVEAFLALDEQFHRDLADLARMPTLTLLMEQLGPFVRLARRSVPTDRAHLLALADEHDQLLDLLEERDADGLRTTLSAHIRDTGPRENRARLELRRPGERQ